MGPPEDAARLLLETAALLLEAAALLLETAALLLETAAELDTGVAELDGGLELETGAALLLVITVLEDGARLLLVVATLEEPPMVLEAPEPDGVTLVPPLPADVLAREELPPEAVPLEPAREELPAALDPVMVDVLDIPLVATLPPLLLPALPGTQVLVATSHV